MTSELTKFKYEQLDESTADFLRQKESNMREIVGKAYTELGKELYEAPQELARQGSKYEGVFEKWYAYLGWKKRTVYNLINRFNLVQNLHEVSQIAQVEELPVSLSYAIASPSSESTPAKAQAKAEVLAGNIDTLKKYRERIKELERKAEHAEQRAEAERSERERLEQENEELANREPEVIKEYIEKDTPELRDRSFDTPYGVKLLDEFYEAMDELSKWQQKYAWITSDNDQLKSFARVDEDMKEEFRKNINMWRTLSEIFDEDDGNIIDAEIININ